MHAERASAFSLPKNIQTQLAAKERQTLDRLRATHQKQGDSMEKAQKAYTQASRKRPPVAPKQLQALADKGFRYMFKAYEAKEALHAYIARLKKKYT